MFVRMIGRRSFLKKCAGAGVASVMLSRLAPGMRGSNEPAADATLLRRLAHDPSRPEYHLLPQHNWMNDPNGPIWWKGQYHLFYQLNPHAAVWGAMHWGHAVSRDMIHWRHESIALAPTPSGPDSEGCFSGSAVVKEGVPTFIYTGVQNAPPDKVTIRDGNDKLRETQLLATAEDDNLLRWKKLAQPVIATPPSGMSVTGFRDPCPWHESDGWYLGVGSGERGKGGSVLLYRSQDLRQWEYLHKLAEGKPNGKQAANPCDSGEMWECPDFFPLGDRHCLLYSTEGKVIWTTGDYDQRTHRYTPTREGVLDHGAFYAPKSFLAPDGRRILWGWIQETRPEVEFSRAGWAGAMALPRVLNVGAQGQLEIHPAAEAERLRGTVVKATVKAATPFRQNLTDLRRELRLHLELSRGTAAVRLLVSGAKVWKLLIDVAGNAVRCGDRTFPLPSLPWPRPELRIYLDGSVIESFIGGRDALTSRVYDLKPGETQLEIAVEGAGHLEVDAWPLKTISPDRLTS